MPRYTETRLAEGVLRVAEKPAPVDSQIPSAGADLWSAYEFTLDGVPVTKDEAVQLIDAELARRHA